MTSPRKPPIRRPGKPRKEPTGCIECGTVYPLKQFLALAGWGKGAFAVAKQHGLKVCRAGGRAYVRGGDFYEWLSRDSVEGASR